MKYSLLFLTLIVACSKEDGITRIYTNLDSLPECSQSVIDSSDQYVKYEADNGDVLYISNITGIRCLRRKK